MSTRLVVACEGCGKLYRSMLGESIAGTRGRATREGWFSYRPTTPPQQTRDFCPTCATPEVRSEHPSARHTRAERRLAIRAAVVAGGSMACVAKDYGISRERVRQIVAMGR